MHGVCTISSVQEFIILRAHSSKKAIDRMSLVDKPNDIGRVGAKQAKGCTIFSNQVSEKYFSSLKY